MSGERGGRTSSWVPWTIWGLAITLAAVGAVFYALNTRHFGDTMFSLLLGWTFPTVGAVVASRRPENPLGWIFLAIGLCGAIGILGVEYGTYGLLTRPGAVPLVGVATAAVAWTIGLSFGLLITFVILLFPTGTLPSRRWRPVAWASGLGIALMTVGVGLHGTRVGGRALLEQLESEGVRPDGVLGVLNDVGHLLVFAGLGAAVASLVIRWRRASAEERQQLRWFAAAAFLVALALTLSAVVGDPVAMVLEVVGTAAIPVALGIAILRYRLYDIDVVINKTLVYGALAVFITAVYVGVVVGVGALIGARGETNLGLQVVATALVAVAFQPARVRVQRLANRLVYGARATPYEVMADFGGRIAASLRVEDVLPEIAEVAARAVGAAAAGVRLDLPGGATREAWWPDGAEPGPVKAAVGVFHQGEPIGELTVTKAAGDPLRPQEEGVLRDLAAQAGLALHNVRLTAELEARLEDVQRRAAELEASRSRLVTTEDRERRRIESAIASGVERRLSQIHDALGRVEARVAVDPEQVSSELERLGAEAGTTLEELRDLARGIYPPLLADQGLEAALEAQTRKIGGAISLRTSGLRRYDQEVEAGLYFCCLELLRDPGASLDIVLEDRHDRLHLRIERPGPLEPEALVRIADRIDALDGELVLEEEDDRAAIVADVPARSVAPVG